MAAGKGTAHSLAACVAGRGVAMHVRGARSASLLAEPANGKAAATSTGLAPRHPRAWGAPGQAPAARKEEAPGEQSCTIPSTTWPALASTVKLRSTKSANLKKKPVPY